MNNLNEKAVSTKPQAEMKSRWYSVNGLTMHVMVSTSSLPTQVPVVLVHGLGVSSRYMLPTATRLAPYFQVYAPDLPGFGKSTTPRQTLNVPELADALVAWLTVADIKQAAFLANSMGCQVVVDLAVRYPGLVSRIILTGPTVDPHHRSGSFEILRLLLDTPSEPLNQIHLAISDYFRCGPRVMWQSFHYMMKDHIEDKLPDVAVPVLVVRGSRDTIASQQWVEKMVCLLPDGRLAVIPGAPHAVNNGAAAQLVELSLPFLQPLILSQATDHNFDTTAT